MLDQAQENATPVFLALNLSALDAGGPGPVFRANLHRALNAHNGDRRRAWARRLGDGFGKKKKRQHQALVIGPKDFPEPCALLRTGAESA